MRQKFSKNDTVCLSKYERGKTVYSAIYFSNKTAGCSLWSSYWNTSYGVLSPGIQNQWDFFLRMNIFKENVRYFFGK